MSPNKKSKTVKREICRHLSESPFAALLFWCRRERMTMPLHSCPATTASTDCQSKNRGLPPPPLLSKRITKLYRSGGAAMTIQPPSTPPCLPVRRNTPFPPFFYVLSSSPWIPPSSPYDPSSSSSSSSPLWRCVQQQQVVRSTVFPFGTKRTPMGKWRGLLALNNNNI